VTCQGLACSCTQRGAPGGTGGTGGQGGGGAGGTGGVSAGIISFGVSVAVPTGVNFTGPSTGAMGGTGGLPNGMNGATGPLGFTLAY
jgi:hypothetical protein